MTSLKLRRIAKSENGAGFPHSYQGQKEGDLPFFKVSDFHLPGNERYLKKCTNWISRGDAVALGARSVPQGSILLPKVGAALLGNARRITTRPSLFDNNVLALVPRTGDSRYLHYWTTTMDAGELSNPGPVPSLTGSEFLDLTVPISSLEGQRAIADFLDTETARIDALIEKKRRLVNLLKVRFKLAIDHALENLSSSEAALGRFVLDLGQGSSPQAAGYPAEEDEWGVLKLSAVKSGHYNPQENKALLGELTDSQMVPRAGDLLVTRSNTPSYVGDVAAVTHTTPRRLLPDLIYRLRLDNTRMSAEFAAYALLASRSRHEISSLARGSSQSMVKLRGEDIRSLPVPVVTPEVQKQAVKFLNQRQQQTSQVLGKLEQQIKLLTEHRQALITAAVTGQIGVPGIAALG